MVSKLKGFEQVDPFELKLNPFTSIGKDWPILVCGAPNEKVGAMTIGWGGMGIMWNKPVVFVVVRPTDVRFTRSFMDEKPLFTLNILGDDQKAAKGFLGSKHGWDFDDKIAAAGLNTGWCGVDLEHDPKIGLGAHVHTPFIEEAQTVLVCEKISATEIPEDEVLDPALWQQWYGKEGQHCLFIAEIRGAFQR